MTSDARTSEVAPDTAGNGIRDVRAAWWWLLVLGIFWTGLGMVVRQAGRDAERLLRG